MIEPLAAIDDEITRLWTQFRHTNVSSSSAPLKIDLLLEQRHELMTDGEMRHGGDTAAVSEWGTLG